MESSTESNIPYVLSYNPNYQCTIHREGQYYALTNDPVGDDKQSLWEIHRYPSDNELTGDPYQDGSAHLFDAAMIEGELLALLEELARPQATEAPPA